MHLKRYLTHIQTLLYSRQEITIVSLRIHEVTPHQSGLIESRLSFWDNSRLEIAEFLITKGTVLVKTNYAYHYQDVDHTLIFRYDNAPHHPEITSHPHHKHTPTGIEATDPPHLQDVLREIDRYLYDET